MGTASVLPRMGSQPPGKSPAGFQKGLGSSSDCGGRGPPTSSASVRPRARTAVLGAGPHPDCSLVSHATCIPDAQAALTGFKCFNSWFFWRAAAAVSLASTSEQCHTLGHAFTAAHPGAHLLLGLCARAGGGPGARLAFPLRQPYSYIPFFHSYRKMLVSVRARGQSSLAPRERCPPVRAHALELFSRQQIYFKV